jgi:SAM-dependent methyltransferase
MTAAASSSGQAGARLEAEYWNGEAGVRWAELYARTDRQLAAASTALMAFAAPRAGERALDVGCGCGTTTLELHQRTGVLVRGVDVSEPMLAVARARATSGAITFAAGDAATMQLAAEHDLVFSRFGVMFFADPVAAFANLRTALAPRGRLAFACWRAADHNPWATIPVAAASSVLPPEPPGDPHAPGAFAFADAERVRALLVAAGFRDVSTTAHDTTVYLGDSLDDAVAGVLAIGPLARRAMKLDAATRARLPALVADALAPLATPHVTLPASIWLVGARP